jgi:riboflavin synthase
VFTGIVEEIGTVTAVTPDGEGHEITIEGKAVLEGTSLGDSIAVNGTCLTVTDLKDSTFKIACAPETLHRTNLGLLRAGDRVNLERSLTPSSRMGGHFVQGHIDGTGTIVDVRPDKESLWYTIAFDPDQMRYVVPKGFIAVDGISLTVVDALDDRFTIMLIAFTQEHATLSSKQAGDLVNIEVDILGKYVERILRRDSDAS